MSLMIRKLRLVEDPADAGSREDAAAHRLRIAIASSDSKSLDAHFNSAGHFMVYEVTPTSSRLLEAIALSDRSDESGNHDAGEDRLGPKVAAITGCNLLFVQAIGAGAAAKVVKAGVHPIKVSTPEPVESVIKKVQSMMESPPPWLRKAMETKKRSSMQFLDEED
jgi:nitrogen fixation protein NifX